MANKPKVNNKSTIVSKKLLIDRVKDEIKINILKNQVEEIIAEFLNQINQALIKGEEIRLLGSFTLKTTIQKPRVAMNLQTKKKMTIPAKRVPKVKFSEDLKKEISKKR